MMTPRRKIVDLEIEGVPTRLQLLIVDWEMCPNQVECWFLIVGCWFRNWVCPNQVDCWLSVPTRLLNSTQWLKRQRMKLAAEKVSRCPLQSSFPGNTVYYKRNTWIHTNAQILMFTNTLTYKYTGVEEWAIQRCASAQWEVHRGPVHTQDLPSRQQGSLRCFSHHHYGNLHHGLHHHHLLHRAMSSADNLFHRAMSSADNCIWF